MFRLLEPDELRQSFLRWSRALADVENQVHWVIHVTFGEDDSRLRREHAAENMALIRRLTTNILQQSDIKDASIQRKRKMVSWDFGYFIQVLHDGAAANL